MLLPVFRHVGHTLFHHLARRELADGLAKQIDLPAFDRQHAREGIDQLGLTIALDAGDAQNLCLADIKGDATHNHVAALITNEKVLDGQRGFPRLRRFFAYNQVDLASDHHRGELLRVDLLR